jgi:hypothetical protein
MKAAIEAMSSKEMGSYKAYRVSIIYLPLYSSHRMQPLIKLSWSLRKHSIAKKLINGSVKTQGDSSPSTKSANCSENTSKLQQARQRLMAAGRQAFSLVTRTSLDHTIFLWRQGTQVLLLRTILLW